MALASLLLLLLSSGCAAKSCRYEDVVPMAVRWSWSWSFDLEGCTSLVLRTWRTKIGDEGSRALAEALKTNGALTTLDLMGNSIGDEGARALAEALKTNGALTTLNLQGNSIGTEGARALAEALKTNGALTELDLRQNSIPGSMLGTLSILEEVLDLRVERRRRCDYVLDLIDQEQAKRLGLHAVFQELGIAGDALARALKWCRDQGAETAEDLTYVKRDEVDPLVEILSLGLPILKQRKLADKLATHFRLPKDEV